MTAKKKMELPSDEEIAARRKRLEYDKLVYEEKLLAYNTSLLEWN